MRFRNCKLKIKEIILDILFPKFCVECGKEGKYICDKCEIFCNDVQNFDNLTCFWEYNGVIKKAIHEIKYKGVTDIIKELIAMKDFDIAEDVFITYVPMHRKKRRKRGFNQAEIIAKELGRKYNLKVVCLLKKIKDTKDQVKLDKEERLENVKDSFSIVRADLRVCPKNILLVDDVYTTGATMKECCKVLKQGGIQNIWGFTLARTL